jgi:hypothetical protein
MYVEDSKITVGDWCNLDWVAVQYGHICRSTFSNAAWCLYVKGAGAGRAQGGWLAAGWRLAGGWLAAGWRLAGWLAGWLAAVVTAG